jgi:hypothetical protein
MDGKKDLSHIIDKARWLDQVNTQIAQVIAQLEPTLKAHCHVVKLTQSSLTLAVDNNIWLTRLRYITPTLLKQLTKTVTFQHLKKIHWQIHLRAPAAKANQSIPVKISAKSQQAIQTLAHAIEDPQLKAALRRLGTVHK